MIPANHDIDITCQYNRIFFLKVFTFWLPGGKIDKKFQITKNETLDNMHIGSLPKYQEKEKHDLNKWISE